MKTSILKLFLALLVVICARPAEAQTAMAADQNPNFSVSRDRYMKMADSLNSWHSTTIQDTYKAVDYLEDKREERLERKTLRRQMRLAGVRNGWYDNNYYSPDYNTPFYNRYNNYYRGRSYGLRYRDNDYLWTTLPLAFALGLLWR